MPRKCETPLVGSGASRNSCGGCFQDALTLSTLRGQHLIGSYGIRKRITGNRVLELDNELDGEEAAGETQEVEPAASSSIPDSADEDGREVAHDNMTP